MNRLTLINRILLTTITATLGIDCLAALPDSSGFFVSTGYSGYTSFCQQANNRPMKLGYPILISNTACFDAGYLFEVNKLKHRLVLESSLISKLKSDNGAGQNYLDTQQSRHYDGIISYTIAMKVLNHKSFCASLINSSGIEIEYRTIYFQNGSEEKTRDVSFYTGPPGIQIKNDFNNKLNVFIEFIPAFYLPWLNTGTIIKSSSEGIDFFSGRYRGFYYMTMINLAVQYKTITLSVRKKNLVGFASRKPDFNLSEIMHYKFNEVIQVNLSTLL